MGMITTLLIGRIESYETEKRNFSSAYRKIATNQRVWLGSRGLQGDSQADIKHHGGLDKAVLASGEVGYEELRARGFVELTPGDLGENITLSAWDEATVCIGDRFSIGETLVEVSQPREPCWKIDALTGMKGLLREVVATGRTGWYLRVLKEGYWQKEMPLILQSRPYPEWSILHANRVMQTGGDVAALMKLPPLAEAWRRELRKHSG